MAMGQCNDAILWYSGGLAILRPLTDAAVAWCDEHLPEDAPRWCGNSYAVEHRYVGDIVTGMREEGLVVR